MKYYVILLGTHFSLAFIMTYSQQDTIQGWVSTVDYNYKKWCSNLLRYCSLVTSERNRFIKKTRPINSEHDVFKYSPDDRRPKCIICKFFVKTNAFFSQHIYSLSTSHASASINDVFALHRQSISQQQKLCCDSSVRNLPT